MTLKLSMTKRSAICFTAILVTCSWSIAQEESPNPIEQLTPASVMQMTEDVERIRATATDLSAAFRYAASKTTPSVVVVLGKRGDVNQTLDQLRLLDETSKNFNVGSGVVWSADGLIVTNNHVVADSKEVLVRLADGREFVADEVKSDVSTDIAMVRIKVPEALTPIEVGDSSKLTVGDWVIAVGCPFNLEQTVSAGIISGNSRLLKGLVRGHFLQTDASINPGNSGGPLANLNGEVIGINTAIFTETGVSAGVGFAIPSNRVKWVVSELESRGFVRRMTLGVTTVPIPQMIAAKLNLPPRNGGAYVARVRNGSPAAKAGLQTGDTVLKIDDQKVHNPEELASIVEQSSMDEPIIIELVRNDEPMQINVQLEARE
jgi:serine protease Do